MIFSNRRTFRLVKSATRLPTKCEHCNNEVEYELFSAKAGPGLSIPITPFFTDKFTLAAKFYYLLCPICDNGIKISRSRAKALGA